MNYGLPYKGSKSMIAPWVVEHLPSADALLDLFAGGGAVTHCAILQGKYNRYIMNDINDGPEVFLKAARGEYKDYYPIVDREEFKKTDDFFIKICYSFGNDCDTYLWSKELEPLKLSASRMLTLPTERERRLEYIKFLRLLRDYLYTKKDWNGRLDADALQEMERIQGIKNSCALQEFASEERIQALASEERIQALKMDYRDVPIPEDCVIYCDIPYKETNFKKLSNGFDYDAYYEWLHSVGRLVIASEYTCPEGCVEIASIKKNVTSAANSNKKWSVEKLFIQEEFLDEYREMIR